MNFQKPSNVLNGHKSLHNREIRGESYPHLYSILQSDSINVALGNFHGKDPIFIINRHFCLFFIQERVNKLVYDINTIIKRGIRQSVKFQSVSRFSIGSKMK